MIITWSFEGKHVLRVSDDVEVHMFAGLDNDHHPTLYLEIGDKAFVMGDGSDIPLDREENPVDESEALDYYSRVVQEVAERFIMTKPNTMDIESIKATVWHYFWLPKRRREGRGEDDFGV